MPMYDFKCREGHYFERMVPLKAFHSKQYCQCGEEASRQISAPMFRVDNTGYNCPITGNWIGSRHQHEENLKKHDCRVLEPGEKEQSQKFREAAEAQFDKTIEDSVERELSTWDSGKLEQLSNELVNGKLDVAIERSAPNV